jgi:hypothetical protein
MQALTEGRSDETVPLSTANQMLKWVTKIDDMFILSLTNVIHTYGHFFSGIAMFVRCDGL